MLEVLHRDGRARIARATLAGGKTLEGPTLLWPETSLAPAPAGLAAVVPAPTPAGASRLELVSGGTWFFPNEAPPGLDEVRIPPTQPAPTTRAQLVAIGDDLAAFHDAGGWASNPKSLVPAWIDARREATPARLLWAPALGTPQDYALWCYLGADLFDASPLLLAAARGQALTADGPLSGDELASLGPGAWTFERLVAHNTQAALAELERVKLHIRRGTLRELAERRSYARAASVEVLRCFDREHRFLEAMAPRHRAAALPAMTADSLWGPEVEAFRAGLRDRYAPPSAPVLVLLPCSQRKPYKMSRSHRQFQRVLDESGIRSHVHEVMVTSPLGLVPRELEEVYPAQAYDIPVTGHWMADEQDIVETQLAALLSKQEYRHVVVHLGQATFDAVKELYPEARHTCLHHPTSQEDLGRLASELARLKAELGTQDARVAGRGRKLRDFQALLSFQFGAAVAEDLVRGADVHGRMPFVKLERDGVQLATTTPERGVASLTLDGARVLAAHATKRVFIGDFWPKGTSSLFAVGVEGADADVRAGDEVAVVRRQPDGTVEVRGCGVAHMAAEEMGRLKRGIAVALRHVAKPAAAPAAAPIAVEVRA